MKKLTAILAVLMVTSLACQTTTVSQGTFRSSLAADPTAIDPLNANETAGQSITQLIFDGLVKYNPKTLEIEPAVAESWTVSKDAKTFTFKLKQGTKFHNGEEVTANSFKIAADYMADPKNKAQASYYLEPIEGYGPMQEKKATELKGVKVKDKYTLEITLANPSAEFLRTLSATGFSPLPKNFKDKSFAKKPVGNGPYKIVRWQRNKKVELTVNEDYYGEKPSIAKVVFKIFTSADAAVRELKAGNLDDALVPQNQVNFTKTTAGQKLVTVPLLSTFSYGFNLKKKPWDNESLRKAIAYAIDKEEIISKTAPKETKAAQSFTAITVPGNDKPLSDLNFDKTKVEAMVKEAGYDKTSDVPDFTISYSTNLSSNEKVSQVIQSQLQEAGFNVKIEGLEHGTFIEKMLGGEFDIFQMKWTGDANFDAFLDPLFTTKNIGMNNVSNYSNKEVDELIQKAQGTIDDTARLNLYREAEKTMLDEVPVIPIYYDSATYLVSNKVDSYLRTPLDELALDQMTLK